MISDLGSDQRLVVLCYEESFPLGLGGNFSSFNLLSPGEPPHVDQAVGCGARKLAENGV